MRPGVKTQSPDWPGEHSNPSPLYHTLICISTPECSPLLLCGRLSPYDQINRPLKTQGSVNEYTQDSKSLGSVQQKGQG